MYSALGQWSFRKWKLVLGAWLVVIVGVIAISIAVGPAFSGAFEIPDSESRDGFDVLDEYFGGFGSGIPGSIVFSADRGVDDPEVMAAMEEIFEFARSRNDGFGIDVVGPYDPGVPAPQVALDGPEAGKIAYASVTIDILIDQTASGLIGGEIEREAEKILEESGLTDEVRVEVGGQALGEFAPPETEFIGIAFAVIVLILAFGSVMAMGLPIGVAVAGVFTGIGLINLLSNVMTMPDFSVQIGAMIGLGVGIDYALFIVTRYRNSLAAGYTPDESVGIAIDTAGRSVIFAGLTVVVSLLGMLLIGLAFITGLGVGAAVTVTVTMVASVTLLPALLGMVGQRVEVSRRRGLIAAGLFALGLFAFGIGVGPVAALGFIAAAVVLLIGLVAPLLGAGKLVAPLNKIVPHREEKPLRETIWFRWSRLIQARPWVALIAGTSALLLLAAPVLSLRMGFSDEGNYPENTTTRQAYDLLSEGFGPGFNGPFIVTATLGSPEDGAALQQLQAAVAGTPGVASASPPIPNNPADPAASEAAIIQVIPETSPQDKATEDLVKSLRDTVIPAAVEGTSLDVNVTGLVPTNMDFTTFLGARILLFFGVVLALSFFLLMAVFRSLLVPLKAVIMNMLGIAAAYGVVVAIFQWGWGSALFGVEPAPIEPFIPMMMFAIVFGLSMDYEVFLLSRIKEEYERTGDAKNSVADGLASTARVITAAAAIMMVVFGSFVFEDNRIIKLFGVGLCMSVFLDASLVRMLLVPATMELLGERNWWLPKWLDKILPNLNIEGSVPPPPGASSNGLAGHTPVHDRQPVSG